MDGGRQAAQLEIHVSTQPSTSDVVRRVSIRYRELVTGTTHAVLEGKGVTDTRLRWAVFHRRMDEIPAVLRAYVEKVARRAIDVGDADVDALKTAGYSEDAIFEITASAAMGAAIMRLERGLVVLHDNSAAS